ncbi:hypothetical protein BGX23_007605 [Mortierella sp. AD031]|nr:hypothetical protein BGX23_007605 [Mortierella sp. AD031]
MSQGGENIDPENHVDATSSILTYASNTADFHPATAEITKTAKQLDAYIQKVSSFPGFVLTYNEQSSLFQSSVNKIIDSVKRMADTVLSQSHGDESRSLFSQAAVTKANDSTLVEVSIFYTILHLQKDTSGKKTYTQQSYTINRFVFKVLAAVLTANAEAFAQEIL